jgi:hypothetical protein
MPDPDFALPYRDQPARVRAACAASGSWIAVAAAEHVRRGRAGGFVQVAHGKAAPLRRLHPGDRIACYSPTGAFRGADRLQAFTAIGIVGDGAPYQVDMGGGFHPFRRDVTWLDAREAPIAPLLDTLEFSNGVRNWGYPFRLGLFPISEHDLRVIAAAMAVEVPVGRLREGAASL